AAKSRKNSSRIVDLAETPSAPIQQNVKSNLSFAVVSGLVVAIGLVFAVEYFDDRMKNPEEIEGMLGLNNLGLVPQVPLAKDGRMLGENVSRFVEAFGSIRTNIQYALPPDGCRSIVVTSSGP